jgi:hypothetical protein
MAKEFAKPFLNSKAWKQCRSGFISERRRIDGGVCQVCRENLGYIVHHKTLLTPQNIQDPEVSLNWDNLSYECKRCHDEHEGHGVGCRSELVCLFDDDGNPVAITPGYESRRL